MEAIKNFNSKICSPKGQLISKCFFLVSSMLPKKRTKKFDLTTMVPQFKLLSFFILKNIQKRHFEIN